MKRYLIVFDAALDFAEGVGKLVDAAAGFTAITVTEITPETFMAIRAALARSGGKS